MLRNKILVARALALSLLIVLSMSGLAKKKTLVILHTNDTHSTVMPLNKNLLIRCWQVGQGICAAWK
jgi:2',3'-cyclic-nucleotide 2'-phosphodiesterase (5'-nucleotidase family)